MINKNKACLIRCEEDRIIQTRHICINTITGKNILKNQTLTFHLHCLAVHFPITPSQSPRKVQPPHPQRIPLAESKKPIEPRRADRWDLRLMGAGPIYRYPLAPEELQLATVKAARPCRYPRERNSGVSRPTPTSARTEIIGGSARPINR